MESSTTCEEVPMGTVTSEEAVNIDCTLLLEYSYKIFVRRLVPAPVRTQLKVSTIWAVLVLQLY